MGSSPDQVKPKAMKLIGICCFSTKHTALRRRAKTGLLRFQIKERLKMAAELMAA
jgi:hypothetical protein